MWIIWGLISIRPVTRCFLRSALRGVILFFERHPGMGGLDIFCAVLDSVSGRWKVENMRSPINSAGDDFGMTYEPGRQRGFFSSNRGDARGWDHIYSFELPEVNHTLTGWVYDKEGVRCRSYGNHSR